MHGWYRFVFGQLCLVPVNCITKCQEDADEDAKKAADAKERQRAHDAAAKERASEAKERAREARQLKKAAGHGGGVFMESF